MALTLLAPAPLPLIASRHLCRSATKLAATTRLELARDDRRLLRAEIIGARRWDRLSPDGRWRRSAQSRLHEPEPFWGEGRICNAHVIATRSTASGVVVIVPFFAPAIPAWFDRRRPPHLADTAAHHLRFSRVIYYDRPLPCIHPSGRGLFGDAVLTKAWAQVLPARHTDHDVLLVHAHLGAQR